MLLAAMLSAVEVAIPYLDGVLPLPPGIFALLAGIVTLADLPPITGRGLVAGTQPG